MGYGNDRPMPTPLSLPLPLHHSTTPSLQHSRTLRLLRSAQIGEPVGLMRRFAEVQEP